MIRKNVIFVLTLAAVACACLWVGSYVPNSWNTCGSTMRGLLFELGAESTCAAGTIIDGSKRTTLLFRGGMIVIGTTYDANRGMFRKFPKTSIPPKLIWRGFAYRNEPGPGSDYLLVAVPIWLIAVAFGAYPAIAFVRGPFRRRRHRLAIDLCRNCGYDLTGNVSGLCPECGKGIK